MPRSAVCLGFVAFLVATLACSGPTEPTDPYEDEIAALWAEGQRWLVAVNQEWVEAGEPPIRGDVRSVTYRRFLFVPHGEPLYLDGEQVGGIFEPGARRIHYHEPMKRGAIPHEACHAILYELNDPRWRCVFHTDCDP